MKLPLFSFQPSLPIQTRYLDAFAGIVTVSVGHCHPRVLRAIQDQQVRRFFLLFFLRGSFSFFQRSSSSSFFRSSKFKKKNEKNSKKQQNRLQHTTTIYLHPEVALFAQELTSRLPPGLDVAYFTNSGTEANDLAILLARAFTRNYDLLALRHAYHGGGGSPYGATAHSTWRHAVPAGFGVRHVACPDAYRGIFSSESGDDDGSSDKNGGGGDDENAIGLKYARELQETIDTCTPGRVAGFLHESIQGVGGVRRRKKRERERERESFWFFLSSLFCAGKKKQGTKEEEKERLTFFPPLSLSLLFLKNKTGGGLCIADEVQTGFGRTGKHYWGFEAHGVVPDIVTMAKGIGNGLPLGAVVTTREVAACLAERLHFNTFGGNPVCAAGGKERRERERERERQGGEFGKQNKTRKNKKKKLTPLFLQPNTQTKTKQKRNEFILLPPQAAPSSPRSTTTGASRSPSPSETGSFEDSRKSKSRMPTLSSGTSAARGSCLGSTSCPTRKPRRPTPLRQPPCPSLSSKRGS